MKTVFRRIRGRIVPIKIKDSHKEIAAGAAGMYGTALAATKVRENTVGSLGQFGNFAVDTAVATGALFVLGKKVPIVGRGTNRIFGAIRRAFR